MRFLEKGDDRQSNNQIFCTVDSGDLWKLRKNAAQKGLPFQNIGVRSAIIEWSNICRAYKRNLCKTIIAKEDKVRNSFNRK